MALQELPSTFAWCNHLTQRFWPGLTGSLVLIDSRPMANAVALKFTGKGSESSAAYGGCEVRYVGLANIHGVREAWYVPSAQEYLPRLLCAKFCANNPASLQAEACVSVLGRV